jgi:orotate phosphoribosyltransferase
MKLDFSEALYWGSVERELASNYRKALSARVLEVDLSQIAYAGLLPTMLLAAAIRSRFRANPRRLSHVTLPLLLEAQPARVLIDMGFLDHLSANGGTVSGDYTRTPLKDAIEIQHLSTIDRLKEVLHELHQTLRRRTDLQVDWEDLIDESFQVVLFELAENAMNYGGDGGAYFGAALSQSSGAEHSGIIRQYDEFTPYLEMVVSDDGPGIDSKIQPPNDWWPPPQWIMNSKAQRALTNRELSLLYSFDFGSTSDPVARSQRIEAFLLPEVAIRPSSVPTGLFCVLKVARRAAGQIIVRTPTTSLSIDFFDDRDRPVVTPLNDLFPSRLAAIPGTHFYLRIPLREIQSPNRIPTDHPNNLSVFDLSRRLEVLRPFDDAIGLSEAALVQRALETVQTRLYQTGDEKVTCVIDQISQSLSSRARLVFFAGIRSLLHGKSTLLLLSPGVESLLSDGESMQLARPHFGTDLRIGVGDPFANHWLAYPSVRSTSDDWLSGHRVTISPEIRTRILAALTGARLEILRGRLGTPVIRRDDGPFRYPTRYYTRIFFDAGALLEEHDSAQLLAEAVAAQYLGHQRSENLDVIVATPETLTATAHHVAEILSGAQLTRPDVVIEKGDTLGLATAVRVAQSKGKTAIIITDVVCQGKILERIVKAISGTVDVVFVFVLVDARPEREANRPFWIAQGQLSIPLFAARFESVSTSEYSPPVERSDGTRGLYVVHPETHRLAYRPIPHGPALGTFQVIEALRTSRALAIDHLEFDDRHFSHYLDFRLFFDEQQSQISDWLTQVSDEWRAEFDTQVAHSSSLLALSRREELDWVLGEPSLRTRFGRTNISRWTTVSGLCHALSRTKGAHAVVVLPAMVSGKTARTVIQTASAAKATSILLLVIAARGMRDQWAFLDGVTRYGETVVRFLRFMDFPMGAFDRVNRPCPICAEVTKLQLLASTNLAGIENLRRSAEVKALAMGVFPADAGVERRESTLGLSPDEQIRLKTALLYEAASYDKTAADALAEVLASSSGQDALLAALARERWDPRFSVLELNQRLGDNFRRIRERAESIMTTSTPPFALGRYLPAILHIDRTLLVEHATSLLQRYRRSPRDVQELALAIAEQKIEPLGIRPQIYADPSSPAVLIDEAVHYVEYETAVAKQFGQKGIQAVLDLWAELARHPELGRQLNELTSRLRTQNAPWSEIRGMIAVLGEIWHNKVRQLIGRLLATGFWTVFTRIAPEKVLLQELEAHMAIILRTADLDPETGRDDHEQARARTLDAVRKFELATESFISFIESHFRSALDATICHVNETPVHDANGRVIPVARNINRSIDNAFMNASQFEALSFDLGSVNWSKHAANSREVPTLSITVEQSEGFIRVSFTDNLPGDFDRASLGGIRRATEFCERFGGLLEIVPPDSTGLKSLVLNLRRISGRSRPQVF